MWDWLVHKMQAWYYDTYCGCHTGGGGGFETFGPWNLF